MEQERRLVAGTGYVELRKQTVNKLYDLNFDCISCVINIIFIFSGSSFEKVCDIVRSLYDQFQIGAASIE